MSAFLCSDFHLSLMAYKLAESCNLDHFPKYNDAVIPQIIGAYLREENVNSINYRYEDSGGITSFTNDWSFSFDSSAVQIAEGLSDLEFIKMAQCYDYQSSEHPDWYGSEGFWLSYRLQDYCMSAIVGKLPGYDHIYWHFGKEKYFPNAA